MKSKGGVKDRMRPYLYLLPAIVSIAILTITPIVYTIYLSFTNKSLKHFTKAAGMKVVGFKNYMDVLTGPLKPVFLPVFIWTFIFAACVCVGGYFIGLIIAILLNNKNMKERSIYKAILILPWALPGTIAALSWQGLLNESYGGINKLLISLGVIKNGVPWLNQVTLAKMSIVMVSIWFTVPFMMNVCLGALTAIPDSYYEAADIDGASKWQKFTKITLPSLASSSYPLIISSFAMNFNNFGAIYMLTKGDPVNPDSAFTGTTDILASAAYKMTGELNRYDLASALAVCVFIVIGAISFVQMKYSGQFEEVD